MLTTMVESNLFSMHKVPSLSQGEASFLLEHPEMKEPRINKKNNGRNVFIRTRLLNSVMQK
jgi:hypothetical protein